jgi:phage FluMu gp28-like protein
MLLEPQTPTVDLSAATLAKYRRVLPENEWRALDAWATTLYPYQRAWVFEPARRAIALGSRQIGKSHGTAGTGVLWGAFNGELTTIVSIGQLESSEVLDKVARHADVLTRLGSRMARVVGKSGTQIRFASGGRVLALPSTGGRSFTGNLFLDELAYQEHAEGVWDSAMPTTIRRGLKSRIASTANGIGNLFHSLWSEPEKHIGYATHETPLKMALDAGMRVDLLDCWSAVAKGDRRLFDQIFNCRFLDGEQQHIPTEAITAATTDNLYVIPGTGVWYAGLDIGENSDRTALVVVHFDGEVARVRAVVTMKRTEHGALQNLVAWAFQTWDLRRLCVDATGLGTFPTQEMAKKFGSQRVEAVRFSSTSKEELATTLYSAFLDEWVRIPSHDGATQTIEPGGSVALQRDVMALRRTRLPGGAVRYDAPRTSEGHADRAWSLALALYGITNRPTGKTVRFDGERTAA